MINKFHTQIRFNESTFSPEMDIRFSINVEQIQDKSAEDIEKIKKEFTEEFFEKLLAATI